MKPSNLNIGERHQFVQFVDVIAVNDTRGQENLTDRATVGKALGDHGKLVAAILLNGQWFDITDEGGVVYRVPVSNVRSARR